MSHFERLIERLRLIARSKSFQYGFPFVSLVVLGSFGLSEFSSLVVAKREANNRKLSTQEALAATGVTQNVNVEQEFKKMQKDLDIDHWENIRGPRPWETPQLTPKGKN